MNRRSEIERQDRERVQRVVNFLRSEQGALSAEVVLATGHTVRVWRDGRVSLRTPQPTGGSPT